MKHSTNDQEIAVIEFGDKNSPELLMLHGGPGYFWLEKEIETLFKQLSEVNIKAVQGRGCGVGEYISPYKDLLDDSLLKRAEDLKAFDNPEILLGHSTGAMVALTAIMEGFIKPKRLILMSPYTTSLGEHEYWVTIKAKKYPKAFAGLVNFVAAKFKEYRGSIPDDLIGNLYMYWGDIFKDLKTDTEKLLANLNYYNFHVIDSIEHLGIADGEPYTVYKEMLENFSNIEGFIKEALIRHGTINSNWWCSNFQDGYPFLQKIKEADFSEVDIQILSGELDEITPPVIVNKLANILNVEATIVPDSYHLAEDAKPGELKAHLVSSLLNYFI